MLRKPMHSTSGYWCRDPRHTTSDLLKKVLRLIVGRWPFRCPIRWTRNGFAELADISDSRPGGRGAARGQRGVGRVCDDGVSIGRCGVLRKNCRKLGWRTTEEGIEVLFKWSAVVAAELISLEIASGKMGG